MARDKRSNRPARDRSADELTKDTPVDPEVARFAARTFERQAAERDAKQAEREARRRDEQHEQLIARKDGAAREVKRLRPLEHVPAGAAAAAEVAYRTALAELIAFETGSAPAWAPASEIPDEPAVHGVAEAGAGDEADEADEEPGASTPEEEG